MPFSPQPLNHLSDESHLPLACNCHAGRRGFLRALVASGRTVVSVLHEISIALQADELLILDQGHIRRHGPCGAPATHAALEAVFEQRVVVRQIDGLWMALPRV